MNPRPFHQQKRSIVWLAAGMYAGHFWSGVSRHRSTGLLEERQKDENLPALGLSGPLIILYCLNNKKIKIIYIQKAPALFSQSEAVVLEGICFLSRLHGIGCSECVSQSHRQCQAQSSRDGAIHSP